MVTTWQDHNGSAWAPGGANASGLEGNARIGRTPAGHTGGALKMRKGIRESDGKLVQIDEFTDELQASSAVPHAWRPRLGKSSGLRCGSGRGRGKGEGARGGGG